MSLPTDQQIREWFKSFPVSRAERDKLERKVLAAVARERRGGVAVVDGYPSSTAGGGRGGSELTSVESAAAQRIEGPARDPHKAYTDKALNFLVMAANAYNVVSGQMRLVDNLLDEAPVVPQRCQACEPAGVHHEPRHFGSVGGRLPTEMHLCGGVYNFVGDHGHLPTDEQVQQYDRTGRWLRRVDPKEKVR